MFRKILVPLDGSPLAEGALPLATRLARAAGAKLRLVMVHQQVPASALPTEVAVSAAEYDRDARTAERGYLREVAARVRETSGVAVTTALLDGDVAGELGTHIDDTDVDLVVMTTHGRGPVSRFWMGSVADRLVRTIAVPILIVQAGSNQDRVMPRRILVPLDGSPRAESALDFAARLARLADGEVILLQVLPPLVPLLADAGALPVVPPGRAVPDGEDDLLVASTREYLESRAEWLRADGLRVRTVVVTDPSPAAAIVALSEAEGVDLVTIATHGNGGLRRLVLGSVTDKVLRSSTRPLLVFRPAPRARRAPVSEAAGGGAARGGRRARMASL